MRVRIDVFHDKEIAQSLRKMPEIAQNAIRKKLNELAVALQEKVRANLGGVILKKKTGQLINSIQKRVEVSGRTVIASVGPSPQTAKAAALEFGGKENYPIPKSGMMPPGKWLYWVDEEGRAVFRKGVTHPPSKAFQYLLHSLEEMQPQIDAGLDEIIDIILQA